MKSKLPMGKKSKQDDESEDIEEGTNPSHQTDATGTDVSEEDEGTEAENNSLIYKLKKKIQSLQKGKSKAKADDSDGEESPVEDAEALKKKKKSKIIQYVIIGALIVFVASDYIFPPDEPVAEVKLKPKGKKNKPKVEAPAEEKPATDTAATTETPATDPTTVTPGQSPVDVTETPVETAPADTTVTETPTDTTTTPVETAPVDTTVTETPTEEPVDTAPVETAPVENTVTDAPAEDTGTGEATTPGEDNLTDQILEDLEKQAKNTQQPEQKKEYVAPPDYEYRGRGLVYNCSGKHWACVDAPSYKTCEDNASSVQYLKKKTECHPFNVYETPKGCEGVQNRMVSSSAKTAFCAE